MLASVTYFIAAHATMFVSENINNPESKFSNNSPRGGINMDTLISGNQTSRLLPGLHTHKKNNCLERMYILVYFV